MHIFECVKYCVDPIPEWARGSWLTQKGRFAVKSKAPREWNTAEYRDRPMTSGNCALLEGVGVYRHGGKNASLRDETAVGEVGVVEGNSMFVYEAASDGVGKFVRREG